jgi:hypothetical protein
MSNFFPPLSHDHMLALESPVSDAEIRRAAFAMGGLKSPGADGFQAIFYQSQWDLVGRDLCSLVKSIFADPSRMRPINETLITLIPKVDHATSLRNFRPISLCNVSYKVVTKIIATRLNQVMEHLISPAQASFVPNRHSSDNIIIFQEVVHSMRIKKRGKGWMAIKIDFEKAYDRLKWLFVKDTLDDIGFPPALFSIIYECISSPSMKMLWNGEALDSFSPQRGIRQGDPISPYLFVLCIERLSHLINLAVEHELWDPIKLARDGLQLSHLVFADDLVLLGEASMKNVGIFNYILSNFCSSSGQKVSHEKSRIFFSKNVTQNDRVQISRSLGFHRTEGCVLCLGPNGDRFYLADQKWS